LLDIVIAYSESFNAQSRGTKRKIGNTNSQALWYRLLCHISKNRDDRLVSNEILDSINFTNFDVCVECIKDKQAKTKKLGAYRTTNKHLRIDTYRHLWSIS